jgi:hypothetical protein
MIRFELLDIRKRANIVKLVDALNRTNPVGFVSGYVASSVSALIQNISF